MKALDICESSERLFGIALSGGDYTKDLHIFAEKVVREIDEKKAQGIGVFTVDGKMIDIAFYDGAKRTIALAKASGVYKGDLRSAVHCAACEFPRSIFTE